MEPIHKNTIKRVAIYKRVSTMDQAREGYSLDAQERVLRAYCEEQGHIVYNIYADEGISGKDIKHRPHMQELIEDARKNVFDIVLVWSLSRFTRSVADLYTTWDYLQKRDIALISYTESFDTSTPTGRAMMGILGVFAQMEREVTAERVAAAMEERANKGLRTCVYVLGYNSIPNGGLTINHKEAEIVRSIFRKYLSLQSFTDVTRWCAHKGYRGKRGSPLYTESVHRILTCPIYCGYYTFHRQLIIPAESCPVPPIIKKDTYNSVQRAIEQKSAGRQQKHPLIYL